MPSLENVNIFLMNRTIISWLFVQFLIHKLIGFPLVNEFRLILRSRGDAHWQWQPSFCLPVDSMRLAGLLGQIPLWGSKWQKESKKSPAPGWHLGERDTRLVIWIGFMMLMRAADESQNSQIWGGITLVARSIPGLLSSPNLPALTRK